MESASEKYSPTELAKGSEPHGQEVEDERRGSQASQASSTKTTRRKSKRRLILETILRALGLEIFLNLQDSKEEKIVLDKSRLQALSRSAVHIIPVMGCFTIISLNFSKLYIGATLKLITVLQFAAKLHEITMIASIAVIVFSFVRHKLTLGDGIPFGAAMAGLEVSRISYLWSREFWGSLLSSKFSWKQKVQLTLVIVTAILLAATVGPSSAVCMIPRTSFWPAGSTDIWLNATYDDLYPTFIDATSVPEACVNTSLAAGLDGCPSSAWTGLLNYVPFFNPTLGPQDSNWMSTSSFAVAFLTIPLSVGLASIHSIRSLYITVEDKNQGGSVDPLATTQPAALADALVLTGSMWATLNATLHGRWASRLDSMHTMDIQQPFVGITCNFNNTAIIGPNDQRPLEFPAGMYMDQSVPNISTTAISRSSLWGTEGDISMPRVAFVDLPTSEGFVNVSVGVVILEPRAQDNNTQLLLPCILSAGWATSKMTLSTGSNYQRGSAAVQSSTFNGLFEENYFTNYCFPSFPLIHISLTAAWAKYINPFLPSQNTSIFGAMASLMNSGQIATGSAQERTNEQGIYTFLLTSLLANALSNTPQNISLQGNITSYPNGLANGNPWLFHSQSFFSAPPPSISKNSNYTKLRINSYVQGISYYPSGATMIFAIFVLSTYTICALSHLVYSVGISGVSSTAWDSISKNLLLGIEGLDRGALEKRIFGWRVRILHKGEGRLVWGFEGEGMEMEREEMGEMGERIRVGEKYGGVFG